jgi:hypothetical protein
VHGFYQWRNKGTSMKDTNFGPYNVGRTLILGDGQTVITELDFKNDFTFNDLDELQQIIQRQNETEDKLRLENIQLIKQNYAQKQAIRDLLEFQNWLKSQSKSTLETVLP